MDFGGAKCRIWRGPNRLKKFILQMLCDRRKADIGHHFDGVKVTLGEAVAPLTTLEPLFGSGLFQIVRSVSRYDECMWAARRKHRPAFSLRVIIAD